MKACHAHRTLPCRLESGQAEQHRESSLKYQTRCVTSYPDGAGYALGSVEGRVAMEFYDTRPEAQANKYAFKVRVPPGGCTNGVALDRLQKWYLQP